MLAEGSDERDRVSAERHHVHLVDADVREGAHLLDEGRGVPADGTVVEHGPPDLVVRTALPRTPVTQDGQLVGDLVGPAPAAANTLQASAYLATSRSVFLSPPPPTMIGGRGGCRGCGELSVSASW